MLCAVFQITLLPIERAMVNTSSRKRRRGTDTGSDAEPEKEYQVEAIIDKRVRGKKTEYMLKWKGYSHAENTVSHVRSSPR